MIDRFSAAACNGCQMCKEICPKKAIRYETNPEGFWLPKVDDSRCVECGLCIKKCPNQSIVNNDKQEPDVKAVWSMDKEVRLASTSGGLFYELARKVLEQDGFVEGCVYDEDFKGAHQTIIESMDELKPLMVSKYVESDAEGIYPEVKQKLLTGKMVLFVGAPCQCAALYSYLGEDYDNLIVVDFLCRGANSPKAHRKYVEYLENKYQGKMVALRSKDKRNGWERFGQSAAFDNGKEYFLPHEEDLRVVAYHRGNLMARESCLDCRFKTLPRYSDLTLGDFWGIKAEEVDDIDSGISLCFINSEKGRKLLESLGSRVKVIDKTLAEAKKGNPAIYQSASCSEHRKQFLAELDNEPFDVLVGKYADKGPSFSQRAKSKVKSILKKYGVGSGLRNIFGMMNSIVPFIKYNYFTPNIVRNNGAYLYPYKGSVIQLAPTAKLVLNGSLQFNAGKYKGSKAEAYLILDDHAYMSVEGPSRINYGSTVHVNHDANLEIGSMTSNVGICFQVRKNVKIGNDCMFGRNATIFDSSYHPTGFSQNTMKTNSEAVTIGDHVWVGAFAFIMQGSTIGDGSIIGSRAYVRGKLEPASTVMADNDMPLTSGMMWARDENPESLAAAVRYYRAAESAADVNRDAAERYSERVVSCLSAAIDYIDFENEMDITGKGLLDSLGMLKVVSALDDEFKITIPYYEIKPANFQNKLVIASLVWKILNSESDTGRQTIVHAVSDAADENDEYAAPDQFAPKKSIVEQVYEHSKRSPQKVAIVSNGDEYTYADLFDLIHGYSAYLQSLGLRRGDMILAKANQSINYVVTYFAAHLAGLEITTVEKNTAKEALYRMADTVKARAVSTKTEEFDAAKDYIFIDALNVLEHTAAKTERIVFPAETDKADILFTTGTTGTSKGIELTHKAVVCGAENMAAGAHMARHTVLICPNPLSHSNAIKQLAATMIAGGTFYILDGITDLSALFDAMNYHSRKVSIVLPPSGIRAIFQLAKNDFAAFADRLEYLMAATAPLPEPDRDTLRAMFPNSRLYNHYGCSESSTISIYDFNKYSELRNCVGLATPNTNVMFVDDNRNPIQSSKDHMGLLAVSGGTVMEGYFNDPVQTAEVLVDGVVYTKDVGYIDENGFIFITGRNDDVINVGGLKVAPAEVESAAMGMDEIADCICIAAADKVSGQALKLLVVPASGTKMDSRKISEYISGQVESYKVPHLYEEVDHIERTYNGKLNRKAYRQ